MKRNRKFFLTLIAAGLIPVMDSPAETPDALANRAVQSNPELRFYAAEIDAAKGSLRTAGTRRNPELSTQAGYKNARDNGRSDDGVVWSISVSQSFEYRGRIALRKAIASGDIELARLHLLQFRHSLAAHVRTLAYTVSLAEDKARAANELADRFRAVTDVLGQRGAPGVAAQLEAQIIDANALSFVRAARETDLAAKMAIAQINQLCGRPANTALKVTAGLVQFRPVSIPTLLQAAQTNAFDLRVREAELAQQGLKVRLAQNERHPALSFGPFYSLETAPEQEHQIGLGISLPLPLWDKNAGNIATSEARREQAEASFVTTQREVERRVTENATVLEAKRLEIGNFDRVGVTKFRETSELADRHYRLGAVPLTTYVETHKQYLELITAVAEMRKDALKAAEELEILTGIKLYGGPEQP
jgi:cobalt-zinc-cadmium efflux system outer membrane protein